MNTDPNSTIPPSKKGALSLLGTFKWEVALAVFCLFICFWQLGKARLFDLDEGLYVACAKQMVLTGDIVTPQLNSRPLRDPSLTHIPFFEKPIMVYWLSATSMKLFGISEFAARLPAVFATLGATLLVVIAGRKWFSRRAGLIAGLIYVTAPMTILDGRQMTTDALLVLWFTGAMLAFKAKRPFLFWFCCSLAILTKGVISLLLPALIIGILEIVNHVTIERLLPKPKAVFQKIEWDSLRNRIKAMKPLLGIALMLLIALPWHIAIWKAGGHDAEGRTWVQEYLIRQHVGRFKGMDRVHNAPFFTYLGYFLIGFFPWACFVPAGFRSKVSQLKDTTESEASDLQFRKFLLAWFWTIFIFFSISAAKLPTYIVPAYPAAALLVGRWLDQKLSSSKGKSAHRIGIRGGALTALITSLILLGASLFLPGLNSSRHFMPDPMIGFVFHVTSILFVGCLVAFLCIRFLPRRSAFYGLLSYASMSAVLVLTTGIEGYSLTNEFLFQPYQDLAAVAKHDADRGIPVVCYHFRDRCPSMLYYAGYSLFERKEDPLMPFFRDKLSPSGEGDIIVSRKNYLEILFPELAGSGYKSSVINESATDGGRWLLVRVVR